MSIHDEVVAMLDCGDGLVEIDELGGLVVIHPGAFGTCNRQMRWQFEIKIIPASRGAPILDVVGEGPLPAVEIDGGQALAAFHQRNGDMDRDRRAGNQIIFGSRPRVLNGWHDQFWTRMHRNDFLRLLRSPGVRPNNSTRDRIRALLRGVEASGTPMRARGPMSQLG